MRSVGTHRYYTVTNSTNSGTSVENWIRICVVVGERDAAIALLLLPPPTPHDIQNNNNWTQIKRMEESAAREFRRRCSRNNKCIESDYDRCSILHFCLYVCTVQCARGVDLWTK